MLKLNKSTSKKQKKLKILQYIHLQQNPSKHKLKLLANLTRQIQKNATPIPMLIIIISLKCQ